MQSVILENFNSFIEIKDDRIVTTSETVAKVFNKQHKHVLRDIRQIIKQCSGDFTKSNFGLCFKNNKLQNGKPQPYYEMSKDGFILLAMGFNGKNAMQFKIAYINAFNYMLKQVSKSSYELMREFQQVCLQHKYEKEMASFCGKKLNEWKGCKPVLEAKLSILENKIQIELPLLLDSKNL